MKIAAVLLNWKRPDNLRQVIAALREQTVPIEIVLWHNGSSDEIEGADWVIRSDRNAGCLARWHVAALTGADYVFCLDDDLIPARADIIEQCAQRSRQEGDNRIIGRSGRTIGPAPRYYRMGKSIGTSAAEDRYADIIKGRFMFVPRRLLAQVPLGFLDYEGRGDDIWISLHTAQTRNHHLLPGFCCRGVS